jgi:hypothetical protein
MQTPPVIADSKELTLSVLILAWGLGIPDNGGLDHSLSQTLVSAYSFHTHQELHLL